MTISPNKNYNLQATGTNINTWGVVVNANFSTIDSNLGGTLAIDVTGNTNVNLTADQAKNLIHNISGTLTGNINYTFPQQGGLYAINNNTIGAFSLSVAVAGGAKSFQITQNSTAFICIDATVPSVDIVSGTSLTFYGSSVGGTPNAVTIPTTIPSGFALTTGALVTWTPTAFNTIAGPTVSVAGTDTVKAKVIGPGGLIDLPAFGFAPGDPIIMQYNGTYWIVLNFVYSGVLVAQGTALAVDILTLFNCYYSTAPFTATLTASTNLANFWWVEFNALGGAITLVPHAGDTINGSASNFIIPQGSSGKIETDANGKFIINFVGVPTNSPAFTGNPTAPTQAVADNSTKLATTAYVDRAGNNSQGLKTVSTSAPSGGSNGDIWYQI